MKTNMNHLRLTAIAAVLLAPGAALAQVDADCTGSNPGTVNCTGPTFANGITHTTNGGDLTVNSANGVTSYGTGGFFTTGVGSNNVTMTKGTGNLLTTAAGTSAPIVIGASSESGDISITTTGTVAGRAATAQYGISAVSTGGGDIASNGGRGQWLSRGQLQTPATGNGHPPTGAKGAIGDFQHGGGLAALELGAGHEANHLVHHLGIVSGGDDIGDGFVALDDAL